MPELKSVVSALRRIDEALASLRRIAISLRPPLLDDLGLSAAMETLVEEFSESSRIPAEFHHTGEEASLSKVAETCLYRVLQEGLTNVAKHARASRVRVNWQTSASLVCLELRDDGVGFEMSHPGIGKGIGLLGMRERLTRLGGKLEVIARPGQGTTVQATLASGGEGGRDD
jgi:signal transduction histidine kinase